MSVFKAYDIRGIAGSEITEELAYKIGKAFAQQIEGKTICVGRDMRESSPALFREFTKALLESGKNIIDIGLVTTPMLYFAAAFYGCAGGASVTASHNPAQYNGFKFVREQAIPISGDTGIYAMEEAVKKNEFPASTELGTITQKDILQDYVNHILKFVDVSTLKKFKIVIDTGNGMAGMVMPELFKHVEADMIPLYFELDSTFPNHEANPLKLETLEDLQDKVREEKADIGIAFDGDADRVGFVDENGFYVSSAEVLSLLAIQVLSDHPGSLVMYDLRQSKIVRDTVENNGGRSIMTRVGHSFIKAQMRDEGALLAGEVSGHYYLKDNYYIESPEIVMLYLLELMTKTGKNLSALVAPLKKYHGSGELNYDVEDKEEAMKIVERAFPDEKTLHLDGLSIEAADWWLNLRPSNTEPLLRLTVESSSKEKMEEIRDKVVDLIS